MLGRKSGTAQIEENQIEAIRKYWVLEKDSAHYFYELLSHTTYHSAQGKKNIFAEVKYLVCQTSLLSPLTSRTLQFGL